MRWQIKIMSHKKIPLQKAYISSSSHQQEHPHANHSKRIPSRLQSNLKTHEKYSSQHADYSVLDKMSLQEDMQKASEDEDELKILDEQSESSEYASDDDYDSQHSQQAPSQRYTSSESSQTIQQLHPLQKKRIQILQKLQLQDICSPQQYEAIITKLHQQNQQLQTDLELLKQKVDLLKLKQLRKNQQKSKIDTQNKRLPEEQYKQLKNTLKLKYKQLQSLQNKSSKSTTAFALQIEYRQFVNKLIELQSQSQTLRSNLKDQKKIHKNLKSQLKKYHGIKINTSKQTQSIQTYNKQLKNKIFIMKKILASQQQSEIELHSFNIQLKERHKKTAQIMRIKLVNKKIQEKKKLMQATRLVTLAGGEVQKLQTQFGTMKLYTMNSKVRAKTEFSFQKDFQIPVLQNASRNRNNSALTEIAQQIPTQKSTKKSTIYDHQQPCKPTVPFTQFHPLTSIQIQSLSHQMNAQTSSLQSISLTLQKRLSFLQQQLNPTYKRQASSYSFAKEKDILISKNKLLVHELKSLYKHKINLLREFNIVDKYYGPYMLETQAAQDQYRSSQLYAGESNMANNPTLPNIRQTKNDFNRSRSEMKFTKVHMEQISDKMRKSILSVGKQVKNYQKRQVEEQKVKKWPSMPTYNNGRSQTVKQTSQQKIPSKREPSKEKSGNQQSQPPQCQDNSTQANMNLGGFTNPQIQATNSSNKLTSDRQDYVGEIQLQNCHFDDRTYCQICPKMYINELNIHHNGTGIIMIKAKYKPEPNSTSSINQEQQQQFSTELSYKISTQTIDSNINSSQVICSSTDLSVNDYIKQVKLFYNVEENFVSRLQVVSKFNVKYDFGNKAHPFPTPLSPHLNLNLAEVKDDTAKRRSKSKNHSQSKKTQQPEIKNSHKYYAFDIKPNEYPGFMFGNYTFKENGQMLLSGLGFTINEEKK